MNGTPEEKTTTPTKEELIRRIMFLLNAPAQQLATLLNAYNRKRCDCGSEPALLKGVKLSPNFRYVCKKCSGDPPVMAVADAAMAVVDAQRSVIEHRKKVETSAQWRTNHKEEAAEYKRRKHAGDSYVESRKELMSDAAWEAKLKEFGYACSTSDCGQPLTLKTAIRWPDGPVYVPICKRCRGRKGAEQRWGKEPSPEYRESLEEAKRDVGKSSS